MDHVDGLEKQEAPADEQEQEQEQEQAEEQEQEQEQENGGGIVNRILTLAGVKKRGHIIHRPAEDEADFKAEISNLTDTIKAKDMELENMSKTLEAKTAEFETYKAGQLEELETMKNSVKESLAALENRVKVEVHNHLAALGYSPDTLPAPVEPKNTAPASLSDGEKFLRELGLR